MNNKAFFKLSYGLYVVSSSCDGKDSACIANTFVQVTFRAGTSLVLR